MKKFFLLGALFCTMSMMVFAQNPDQKADVKPKSADISTIMLGNELAKYGYETQSAVSLMEAARIISQIPTQAYTGQPTDRGAAPSNTDAKSSHVDFNPWTLLADAKKFAGNDAHLLALIEQQEKTMKAQEAANRGNVRGPVSEINTVAAHSYKIYTETFRGGELAEVAVIGDGDTDLDLYIYDQNGNLVAYDEDYSDDCYVAWYPRVTSSYRIKIVNRGGVYNRYLVATN